MSAADAQRVVDLVRRLRDTAMASAPVVFKFDASVPRGADSLALHQALANHLMIPLPSMHMCNPVLSDMGASMTFVVYDDPQRSVRAWLAFVKLAMDALCIHKALPPAFPCVFVYNIDWKADFPRIDEAPPLLPSRQEKGLAALCQRSGEKRRSSPLADDSARKRARTVVALEQICGAARREDDPVLTGKVHELLASGHVGLRPGPELDPMP